MKRLGGEGDVFPGDGDLKRLLKRYCICHSEKNQYVGIWTPVTGMKMRFCERCIRVNRQGLAVAGGMKQPNGDKLLQKVRWT